MKHHVRALPDSPKKGSHLVVCLPDIHVSRAHPWHDRDYLAVALRVIEELRPARVVLHGDVLDAKAFSAHPSQEVEDFAHDFLVDEVGPTNILLNQLADCAKQVAFVEGNHEFRVRRRCAESKAFAAVRSMIDPRTVLSAGRKPSEFVWVPYARDEILRYEITPSLWAIHGWSIAKRAAQAHLDAARSVSITYGHTHRMESVTSRLPATGEVLHAWSPGCLSPLQETWLHGKPSTWVHGFSMIYVADDLSSFTHYSVSVDRGRCYLPSGREVDAQ